jgi:hypothetical protein
LNAPESGQAPNGDFMPGNSNLLHSRVAKEDEFYTPLSMIENELKHYKHHFKDKTVLCNCDDPRVSNFFRYFVIYFDVLELKKVIATCYKNDDADLFSQGNAEEAVYLEYDGSIKYSGEDDFAKIPCKRLKGNGDFRNPECVDFLKQADIVVTNPPFSLFKEYVPFLFKYEKKFLIVGNINNISYKSIMPLIKNNKMWCGINNGHFWFQVPDYYEEKKTDFKIENGIKYRRMGNICWFTNLEISRTHEILETGKRYSSDRYVQYENYNAINIDATSEIPMDYEGVMGVPLGFFTKYNPQQFRVLGQTDSSDVCEEVENLRIPGTFRGRGLIDGKQKAPRILIQKITREG